MCVQKLNIVYKAKHGNDIFLLITKLLCINLGMYIYLPSSKQYILLFVPVQDLVSTQNQNGQADDARCECKWILQMLYYHLADINVNIIQSYYPRSIVSLLPYYDKSSSLSSQIFNRTIISR